MRIKIIWMIYFYMIYSIYRRRCHKYCRMCIHFLRLPHTFQMSIHSLDLKFWYRRLGYQSVYHQILRSQPNPGVRRTDIGSYILELDPHCRVGHWELMGQGTHPLANTPIRCSSRFRQHDTKMIFLYAKSTSINIISCKIRV